MDDADVTQQRQEFEEATRRLAFSNSTPVAVATGLCLWCEVDLPTPRRWCDAYCRDCWERENLKKRLRKVE